MLRVIFMGTPDLACASLDALLQTSGLEVAAVVAQPDKPKGRDLKLQPPPVKQLALSKDIPVLQPARARDTVFIQQLADFRADVIAVAAYGQILPQAILDFPRLGCLNVHTSLLPKYRGAAPIQWAILNDEPETGVTIMKMDAGLDTGDILALERTPIFKEDNAQTLHDRLAKIGGALLVKTIFGLAEGKIIPQKQPGEGVIYARKITKEDGRLDWTQPARVLWNRIRAFTPWPGAFTFQPADPKPRLLKIWEADVIENRSGRPGEVLELSKSGIVIGCGQNSLRIISLQREGGRRVTAQEFASGSDLKAGDRLT